jgi:hypothetical protein
VQTFGTLFMALWMTATVLTVTTLGAIGAHLRIASPQTAVAAVVFTVAQVWFGLKSRQRIGDAT